ncbi:MAG: hypothetical protein IKX47_06475, partial [Oscillospiraceae bacterium]|nr:hypothetical protein [Oscillospiraceae bacterium]
EGDIHISDHWEGFAVHDIPREYPNAVIVFSLDTFPLKFINSDGIISYKKENFGFYRVYESKEAFKKAVWDDLEYVDHEYYDIALP